MPKFFEFNNENFAVFFKKVFDSNTSNEFNIIIYTFMTNLKVIDVPSIAENEKGA